MPAASPQHEAAAAGGGFTVLRSITGRVATKRFFLGPRGRIGKHGYGRERLFSLACRAANGIHEFATLLRRLERDPRAFIVRASPLPRVNLRRARRLLHPDPRTGDRPTFEPAARAWAMLDLDGVACPAGLDPRVPGDAAELIEYLIGLLPPEFHDASCFWQWSASQSVPERLDCEPSDRLRAHLFFWLDCPVPDRELRRWARTLKRDGLAIDPTVFAPVQAHYTAAPVFDGLRDPLPLRSGFRNGLVDAVPLVLPPAEQTLGTADGHGRVRAGNGAGVGVHLERIGPEGYQDPIMATVAAYIARHGSQADDEHLKDVIRERIAQAEPQYPRSTADIDRYRSDGYLDGKIAWTRARQQEREQAAVAAAEHTSLQAYFGADAADRDGMLAAQAEAIRSWVERNYAIAKARREIERRREAAHAEAGLAGDAPATADPDAEVSRRKAAISWRVRREVLAEIGLDNLPKDGERLLITGAQGTGKSRTVAEAIAGMTDDITMRWLVPTLDKAEEQAEEYRRLSVPGCLLVTVVRGRSAPDPDNSGQAMCPRHAVVNRAAAMAVDVQEAICRHCQLRQQCGYQRQRSDLQGRESGLFLAASGQAQRALRRHRRARVGHRGDPPDHRKLVDRAPPNTAPA